MLSITSCKKCSNTIISNDNAENPTGDYYKCPYNVDTITPYFYVLKLGFTGVYIIFVFLL